MPQKTEYVIDGALFGTLEEFASHFSERVLGGYKWRGNLDAFNDILRGGFGTPDEGFTLVWKNSDLSRKRLGHDETAAILRKRLNTCHPANVPLVEAELTAARRHAGPTIFDTLVEILNLHGPDGRESEDGVELRLQ
jgi:RNAse (barnase) inhibitor barstar